ncbi:hypothetical protein AB0E00_24930 [Streptomyces sp. NPDC048110]|uniref:hypothetical protein n=1 Tax=Streptomyces sp. NPDC048110 TaxID=3155483 RepID=UPI0033FD29BC
MNTSAGRCRTSTTSARDAAARTTLLSRRTFSGHSYAVRARTAPGRCRRAKRSVTQRESPFGRFGRPQRQPRPQVVGRRWACRRRPGRARAGAGRWARRRGRRRLRRGATRDGVRKLRRDGDYHVVGYGENIGSPTIDVISSEINFIGNLVGGYTDLCELVLAAQGRVRLHTVTYPLDRFRDALTGLDAGRVRVRAVLVP